MKTIVVYESNTGFTKQYAEWIAQELSCEAFPLKTAGSALREAERVIFGGWVMANKINGLPKLQKAYSGAMTVFAVGAFPAGDDVSERLRAENGLQDVPFFYFQGGIRTEKLNFLHRKMLGMAAKMLSKQAEGAAQEMKFDSFEAADRAYIEPLVQAVKEAQA
jgi:hypothetical protein